MSIPLERPTASAPPAASASLTVPLVSRRRERGRTLQKLQDAIPAAALLYAGVQGLLAHARGVELSLALGEIAFGSLLLRSMAMEVRAALKRGNDHDEASHRSVDWTEILAAAVLALEALEHWRARGHFPRPTALLALVTLVLGLTHGRLEARNLRRRALRIDDQGLRFGGRFFRRFSASWDEILRIDISTDSASIATRSGRTRKLDLADLRNPQAVAAALGDAQRRLALRLAAGAAARAAGQGLTARPPAGTLQPGRDLAK